MAEREITIDMLLSDVGENFTFTIPLTDLDLEPDNAEELSDEEHVHAAIEFPGPPPVRTKGSV